MATIKVRTGLKPPREEAVKVIGLSVLLYCFFTGTREDTREKVPHSRIMLLVCMIYSIFFLIISESFFPT